MKWVLLVLAVWAACEYLNRWSLKRSARRLLEHTAAVYRGVHEYRSVGIDRYSHLDRGFYDTVTTALEEQGFRCVGDVEDVTATLAGPGKPTPIRVLVGDRGATTAGVYHLIAGGTVGLLLALLGKRSHKVVDLESALEDGRFVVTSTAELASGLDSPPEIAIEYFPAATPVRSLLERHRQRLESSLAGSRPIEVRSLADVLRQQERLDQVKSAFRQARGGRLSVEEITRVSGGRGRKTSEQLAREMERESTRGRAG